MTTSCDPVDNPVDKGGQWRTPLDSIARFRTFALKASREISREWASSVPAARPPLLAPRSGALVLLLTRNTNNPHAPHEDTHALG